MRLHDTATPANLERVNADRRLHDTPATPANRSDTSFEKGGKREANCSDTASEKTKTGGYKTDTATPANRSDTSLEGGTKEATRLIQ